MIKQGRSELGEGHGKYMEWGFMVKRGWEGR